MYETPKVASHFGCKEQHVPVSAGGFQALLSAGNPALPCACASCTSHFPHPFFQLPFLRKHPSLPPAEHWHGYAARVGWARACGLWDQYIRIRKASTNGIRRKSRIPHPLCCPEPSSASQALLFPQKGSEQLGRGGGRKQREPHPWPKSNCEEEKSASFERN